MQSNDARAGGTVHAHVTADSRAQWFVLTDAADLDGAVTSGRWLKAAPDATAEVRR